jgi:hypothetical protein
VRSGGVKISICFLYSVWVQLDVTVQTFLLLRLTRCHEYKRWKSNIRLLAERYGTLV